MRSNDKFMTGIDGALYDTSAKRWAYNEPLRANYSGHKLEFESLHDVKASIRAGEFTFPGGYRLAFVTSDAAILSYKTVVDNWRLVVGEWFDPHPNDQWRVVGLVNVDDCDDTMVCDHSGEVLNDPDSDY